jgi:hypothetical protein
MPDNDTRCCLAAKIAQDKGNAEEKFAEQTDHGKTSADIKGMVTSGDVQGGRPDGA